MPGQGDDRERTLGGNYEESIVYSTGMLREAAEELHRSVQLISPKANEQISGNTFAAGQSAFSLLPYDRNRVRASIKIPTNQPGTATAQLGGAFIGSKEDVRAGGGYWLGIGDSVTIESADEIHAIGAANPVFIAVLIERQGGDVI